jgi:transcriptional regulator with XRE-family HTH domain
MKVHEKIRFMRQSKNWSQDEMAEKLAMSVNGYAKIEQGKTDAHFSKLEQIAEIFDMDVVELLTLGERNIICLIGDNSTISMSQLIGSSKELTFEIQKLQLVIEHQQQEITYLKEIIELLKHKSID